MASKHTNSNNGGFLSQLWYRGVNQEFEYQVPGVYRRDFTERAEKLRFGKPDKEDKHFASNARSSSSSEVREPCT